MAPEKPNSNDENAEPRLKFVKQTLTNVFGFVVGHPHPPSHVAHDLGNHGS